MLPVGCSQLHCAGSPAAVLADCWEAIPAQPAVAEHLDDLCGDPGNCCSGRPCSCASNSHTQDALRLLAKRGHRSVPQHMIYRLYCMLYANVFGNGCKTWEFLPDLAAFNHSCRPNCEVDSGWRPRSQLHSYSGPEPPCSPPSAAGGACKQQEVFATIVTTTAEVKAGEELCFSYLRGALLGKRAAPRRQALSDGWQFEC
eukprot:gene1173-2676_t